MLAGRVQPKTLFCKRKASCAGEEFSMSNFEIRPVSEHDAEEIARIDQSLTGNWRIEHWEERIAFAARRDPEGSFVATQNSRVVAYLFSDARGQEYGMDEVTGWIEAVGVAPEQQRAGAGQRLVERAMHRFRETGVNQVRTLVSQSQSQLESFFHHFGFEEEPIKVLRLSLSAEQGRKE